MILGFELADEESSYLEMKKYDQIIFELDDWNNLHFNSKINGTFRARLTPMYQSSKFQYLDL